ncbi:MAG: hypothetical protein QHI38_04175 [Armatimonadota bacterium]|nr:hypothetical protein [Armatimonadota bacterium]
MVECRAKTINEVQSGKERQNIPFIKVTGGEGDMRLKIVLSLTVLAALVAASSALAAPWYKIGTSGFTTQVSLMQDAKRIRFNDIAVDNAGNIYATAVNGNNNGTPGGLTIYKAGGGKIDVDLNALGYPGGITKLVKAGDGAIYGLQNWLEINWSYNSGVPNRIIRINPDGTVTGIYSPGPAADKNRIGGLTVGADGNLYWTQNGADSYWKYHFLWRYDVASAQVEEAPINNVNNGWSETHRMFDLEWIGGDMFAVIKMGNQQWRADLISWTQNRISANVSDPGWGRDWVTALAYDPVQNRLWAGGRGTSNRNIMSRWNNPAGQGGSDVWHALNTDADAGATWWVSALDTDANGDAWMSFGIASATNNLFGYRGHVIRRDAYLNMYDEGAPDPTGDIAALHCEGNVVYALVINANGGYDLYSTVPEPSMLSVFAVGTGFMGLGRIIRRRK